MRRQMVNEVGPDQLVVVLDAQGASALQVTRKAQLCKDTAVTLNKVHSPFCAAWPRPPLQHLRSLQVYLLSRVSVQPCMGCCSESHSTAAASS